MDKLPIIEIKEINRNIAKIDTFQDLVGVADLDGGLNLTSLKPGEFSPPVRLNALIIVLVLKGKGTIRLDYVDYHLKEDTFLSIMPDRIVQSTPSSPDFKAIMLVADQTFMEELRPEKRSPSMTNYMKIRKNPCIQFEPEEAAHLTTCFQMVRNKILLRSHCFHKEVMLNSFMAFMLEMANILMPKSDSMAIPTLSRKEEIVNQFLQLLLTHCKEYHVVTFYAEKLFITPQYLSLVLKDQTGKSANKWIDEALILEAKILLKTPQTTVQQVADILHFSDQSTFGKFFKKHMGMSPMEFRKSK